MNLKVKQARDFAIERHGTQAYGDKPYIYHLDMVYQIALDAGLDEDYLIAAYLHDTIEDTKTTKEELAKLFGENVANLVDAVSGTGATRKEKKESMIKKLQAFPKAINLKMIDRLANMRESVNMPKLLKMYINELPDYLPLFEEGNSYLHQELKGFLAERKMKLN